MHDLRRDQRVVRSVERKCIRWHGDSQGCRKSHRRISKVPFRPSDETKAERFRRAFYALAEAALVGCRKRFKITAERYQALATLIRLQADERE